MTVVVLSPHLDDAAISTYSVLDTALAGEEVFVVNVFTAGPRTPGALSLWDRVCGYTDSTEVAARRVEEDFRALGTLGIIPINLGLRDALVRKADGDPDPTVGDLALAIAGALPIAEEYDVFAPLGGGPRPHVDHVLVRDTARLFARDGTIDLVLYADQPYVYKNRAWPSWIEPTDEPEASWWSRFPRAVPEMVSLTEGLDVLRLDERDAGLKLDLMKLYETQFEALNTRLRTKNLLRDPALYGIEVFWRINGA